MSQWTHVVGSLYIETYKEEDNTKKFVENILKNAPKITGSEKDADIFVNPLSGHNTWTSCDCERCIYKDTIVHFNEGGFQCDAENTFECPEGDYQTCVVITIVGDLEKQQKKRLKNLLDFFKNKTLI